MAQAVDSLNSGLVRLGGAAIYLAQLTHKLIGVYLAKVPKRASRHISIDAAVFKLTQRFIICDCDFRLRQLRTANCDCELRTATLRTAALRATWATGQRGNYDSRPFEQKYAFHLEPTARGVIVPIGHSLPNYISAIYTESSIYSHYGRNYGHHRGSHGDRGRRQFKRYRSRRRKHL